MTENARGTFKPEKTERTIGVTHYVAVVHRCGCKNLGEKE